MITENPYKPYDRAYRRMTADDIRSATRGLGLRDLTREEIIKTRDEHEKIDSFASKVIVEACQQELDRRWINGVLT